MPKNLVAKASVVVDAPAAAVFDALVDPSALKEYMFGSTVISDWKKGSKIVFKGEWKGKPYEDKGLILQLEPGKLGGRQSSARSGGRPCAEGETVRGSSGGAGDV